MPPYIAQDWTRHDRTGRNDRVEVLIALQRVGASVVLGMPEAAVEAGLVNMVLPLPWIAARHAQLSRVEECKGMS